MNDKSDRNVLPPEPLPAGRAAELTLEFNRAAAPGTVLRLPRPRRNHDAVVPEPPDGSAD